jgi:hypothetical protein
MNEQPHLLELQPMSTSETVDQGPGAPTRKSSMLLKGTEHDDDHDHDTGNSLIRDMDTSSAQPGDASLVFYPISLYVGPEENDSNSDVADPVEDTGQCTPMHAQKNKQHNMLHYRTILDDKPMLEHAIQDCFQLAMSTHDVTHTLEKAVWHPWADDNHNLKEYEKIYHGSPAAIPCVDWNKEQEALQSWVPRPLSLPTWAVPY